jgi:hypothetical protein
MNNYCLKKNCCAANLISPIEKLFGDVRYEYDFLKNRLRETNDPQIYDLFT